MTAADLRIALLTYSVKPRGGVVHTLALAEALQRNGVRVHVFGLGPQAEGFFRPVEVPFTLFPAPEGTGSLEQKVFASVDRLAEGLAGVAGEFDLLHPQDCISGRAATRVRDALSAHAGPGGRLPVLRTVHHVDDFTTAALIDCQRRAIEEPDRLLVVSEQWRDILHRDYGVDSDVVRNGVDPDRFGPIAAAERARLRASIGADGGTGGDGADGSGRRPVLLAVGGVEPRKGTAVLFAALGLLRGRGVRPVLAIAGGHSFQDYEAYRVQTLARLPELGLELGRDVVQLGTLSEAELGAWYRSADALAFPSVKEGFGLVALEALAVDLPVVASSLPAFTEFLTDGQDALLPEVGDPAALADALQRVLVDGDLRRMLVEGGRRVVPRFTWDATARRHAEIYAELVAVPSRAT